ncbi:glycoside hydrolase, partial [Syncephalastrum racemosum]
SKPLPLDSIPWSQITHINYGFTTLNEEVTPTLSNRAQLSKMIEKAHENNVKVLVSIGGDDRNRMMDKMIASAEHRSAFVNKTMEWMHSFSIDGEALYSTSNMPCSNITSDKSENDFAGLLRDLRKSIGEDRLLTVATGAQTSNRTLLAETYNDVVDWVYVMAYDTYVGEQQPDIIGANAALYTTPNATIPLSVDYIWEAWLSAGMRPAKMVLGLPFYGYAYKARKDDDRMHPLRSSVLGPAHPQRPQGDADDALTRTNPTQTVDNQKLRPFTDQKRGYTGLWKWRSLRNAGLLRDVDTPGGQWVRNWDEASQTPWLYNPVSRVIISYDNPDSLSLKASFARCRGARGVGVQDLAFDYYISGKGELLEAVKSQFLNRSACSAKHLPATRVEGEDVIVYHPTSSGGHVASATLLGAIFSLFIFYMPLSLLYLS